MARTTSKPVSKSAPATPDVSIPNPVRDKSSLLDGLGGTKKPKTSKTASTHPRLALTEEARVKVREWVPLAIIAEIFKKRKEAVQEEMDEEITDQFYEIWWELRNYPDNPTLNTEDDNGRPDTEALFIFEERFRIEKLVSDDVNQEMIDRLISVGLTKTNATRLVNDELIIAEDKFINFTALLQGRKVGKQWVNPTLIEQQAAKKAIALLRGISKEPLTDAEMQAAITITDFQCTVKPGFLERACTYCESLEQLKNMMKNVFRPVVSHRSAKFAISDASEVRNRRLVGEAANVLSVALGVESEDE